MTFETTGKFLPAKGFIVHMESSQKCLDTVQITGKATVGSSAATTKNWYAYPLVGDIPAVAGDEANVTGFLVLGGPWPALAADAVDTEKKTQINGFDGAVLCETLIPANDIDGAAFNLANIKGAAALSNVKWVTEPAKTTEQIGGTSS